MLLQPLQNDVASIAKLLPSVVWQGICNTFSTPETLGKCWTTISKRCRTLWSVANMLRKHFAIISQPLQNIEKPCQVLPGVSEPFLDYLRAAID